MQCDLWLHCEKLEGRGENVKVTSQRLRDWQTQKLPPTPQNLPGAAAPPLASHHHRHQHCHCCCFGEQPTAVGVTAACVAADTPRCAPRAQPSAAPTAAGKPPPLCLHPASSLTGTQCFHCEAEVEEGGGSSSGAGAEGTAGASTVLEPGA